MSDDAASVRRGPDPWELGFGLAVLAFGAVALLVWFPSDIRGGFMERSPAGKPEPGDSFFPVMLVAMMMALGMVQVIRTLLTARTDAPTENLDVGNVRFLLFFVLLFGGAVALMRWSGPLAVQVFEAGTYRNLSDTPPWKYIGYIVGGVWLGYGAVVWIEGRVRFKPLLVVCFALFVLVVIFDLLLGTVRLPPNADL